MQVTVMISEGEAYELSAEIPDTVDTSKWTRNDWRVFGYAMAHAKFDDQDELIKMVGEVNVHTRHLEGDTEVHTVEADDTIVYDSWDQNWSLRDALTTVRAWEEDKPESEAILHIIDKALRGDRC